MFWTIMLISISLSLDALGIGVSYRLKGVTITPIAKVTIGIVSTMVMWGSLRLGEIICRILSPEVANIAGISILAVIGLLFIKNALFGGKEAAYDFNRSKKIDWWEALILGFALSADSISAGVAAVTLGLGSIIIPISVGAMQVLFLNLAELIVRKNPYLKKKDNKFCGVCSGVLLLMIAFIRAIK